MPTLRAMFRIISVTCLLTRKALRLIIGASLSEPHTYRTTVQNPPYIYIRAVRPSLRPASNLVPRRAPLNAQRANVGSASNDSKVNNIALKTATLVLRFSWRSSLPTEQLV